MNGPPDGRPSANDSSSNNRPYVDGHTLMPIGAMAVLVSLLFAAYGYFQHQFASVLKEIGEANMRIEKLEERSMDRWTQTDQAMWVLTLQRDNPSLDVPPPARAPANKQARPSGS